MEAIQLPEEEKMGRNMVMSLIKTLRKEYDTEKLSQNFMNEKYIKLVVINTLNLMLETLPYFYRKKKIAMAAY